MIALVIIGLITLSNCTSFNSAKRSSGGLYQMNYNVVDTVSTYALENDTLKQTIEIKVISKTEIHFTLNSVNTRNNTSCQISGTAKSKSNFDPEIDEGEDGISYPAQEYFFEGKECLLSIRIDFIKRNRLRVIETNCEKLHDASTPFFSTGILNLKH